MARALLFTHMASLLSKVEAQIPPNIRIRRQLYTFVSKSGLGGLVARALGGVAWVAGGPGWLGGPGGGLGGLGVRFSPF